MKRMRKSFITAAAVAMVSLGLAAQTRNMVVVGKDGSETKFNRNDIREVIFAEAPDYVSADYLLAARYTTKDGNATYRIDFATGNPDDAGDPLAGDFQISLTLLGGLSEEAANAIIPAGYYRIGNGTELMTFSNGGIWSRAEDGGEVLSDMLIDGTVDVRYDNGSYDIRCELTTMSGESVNARYRGKIAFSVGTSDFGGFDTPQDVEFEGVQGRYYGNWFNYFADDMTIEFYTGEFSDTGAQIEGYWLNLELYAPKSDDPMNFVPKVADGVYNVDSREAVAYNTYLPYTFIYGRALEIFGEVYPVHTYITYLDKSGTRKIAYITDGTITVSESGTRFVFDLVADNGIAITGSYSGKVTIENKCDNATSEPERPYSYLPSDRALQFPSNAVCYAFNLGNYIKEDINVFTLQFTEPNYASGDYLAVDILVKGDKVVDGTYTVGGSLAEGTAIHGCLDSGGNQLFSWFGDLDPDAEDISAPISGGTLTIETAGDGKVKGTFDFVDDNGHKITGSLTCEINYPVWETAPRRAVVRQAR